MRHGTGETSCRSGRRCSTAGTDAPGEPRLASSARSRPPTRPTAVTTARSRSGPVAGPPAAGHPAGSPVQPARPPAVRRPVGRRDRRTGRAQTDRRGGLAGLRRPRGRGLRAPRPPGDDRLVGGRHRRVDDHVIGARRTHGGPAGRLPGGPAGRAVRGVPADHALGGPGSHRIGRRPGRDLERDAVLLAPVGPLPRTSSSSTTSTPRCGRWSSPPGMAESGYAIEHRLAPPVYRRTRIVTLSSSSKREIVDQLGIPVHGCRLPRRGRTPVLARGRALRRRRWWRRSAGWCRSSGFICSSRPWSSSSPSHPDLQAVIAGEGYERPALEALIRDAGAESWISLPGYLTEEDLIDLYRRAWVVASTSLREGWGMTRHRGRRLWDARRWCRGSAVTRTRCGTGSPASWSTGPTSSPEPSTPSSVTTSCASSSGSPPWTTPSQFTWDATARGALAALAAEAMARDRR